MADEIDIRTALDSDAFVRETGKMRTALGLVAQSGAEMAAALSSQLQQIGADIDTLAARQQQTAQILGSSGSSETLRQDQALITLLQTSYHALSGEVVELTQNIQASNGAMSGTESLSQQIVGLGTFASAVKGVSEGLKGVSGAFGIAQNTAALFGAKSSELAAVLAKLQQAQGIVNGVEQVSNALRKEGHLRTSLMPAITGAWSRAQGVLNTQLGLGAVASKALMFSGIGLIIGAVGALISLYSSWKTKQEEAREEQRLQAEQNQKFAEAVAEHVGSQMLAYRQLQQEWSQLGSEMDKRQFIDRNIEAFRQLGLAVGSVSDAENVLVENTAAVLEAFKLRARAKAAEQLAVEAYKQGITKQMESEQRRQTTTPEDRDKTLNYMAGKGLMERAAIKANYKGWDLYYAGQAADAMRGEADKEIHRGDRYMAMGLADEGRASAVLAKAGIKSSSNRPSIASGSTSRNSVDVNRIVLDNTLKLEAQQLALLEDGKDKRLDLIDLERREKQAALRREYDDIAKQYKANGQFVPQEITDVFNQRGVAIEKEATQKTAAVNDDYAAQFAERERQLTAVLSTEEEKRRADIQTRYDAMRQWTLEAEKNGNITPQQASEHMGNISKAQRREELGDLVSQYQTREQKIQEIVASSLEEQERLRDQGYFTEAAEVAKQLNKTISAMSLEDDSIQKLFGSLDEMTVSEIDNLIGEIQSKLDSGSLELNEVDTKKVLGGLNKAKQQIIAVNPFKGLADSVKDVFSKGSEGAGQSTEEIKAKWENLSKSTQGCFDFVNDAVAGCEVLGDAIGDSGKASMQLIQSVTMAGMGLASAIKSAETGTIVLAAISAALAVVGALFSLFNDDKNHEKRIQALQAEIDQLSYSYDRLGRSVQQTYFTNTEAEKNALKEQREAIKKQIAELERKNFIGQYNDQIKQLKKELQDLDFKGDVYDQMDAQAANLQQQQLKIQQQIREEEAKKKTDDGKITDWEKQIQDLKDQEKELERQRIEMLAGTDIKSAIDQFADALTEAYAKGEDGAKVLGDTTRKVMANAVKEALKKQLLAKGMEEAVNFLGGAMKDGLLSETDQSEFERMTREAGERYMAGMKAYDSLFKDPAAAKEEEKQAEGMRGEISEKITEQTASKLEGLFRLGVDLQARLASLGADQLATAQSSLVQVADIARTGIAIEANTRRTADNTDGLRDRLDTVAAELRTIKNNTANNQVWAQR